MKKALIGLLLFCCISGECCLVQAGGLEPLKEEALAAYNSERWNQVMVLTSEILTSEPENLEAQYMLGVAELKSNLAEKALVRFNWLTHKAPDVGAYRYGLATALLMHGEDEQAMVQAEYACQLSPDNSDFKKLFDELRSSCRPVDKSSETQEKIEDNDEKACATVISEPRVAALIECFEDDSLKAYEELSDEILCRSEILAKADISRLHPYLDQKCQSLKHEVLRQYVLWRMGEVNDIDFALWLGHSGRAADWRNDELLVRVSEQILQSGITAHIVVMPEDVKTGEHYWFDLLSEESQQAFLQGDFTRSFELHVESGNNRNDSLWHYQAARLALEVWQSSAFDNSWLVRAVEHLRSSEGDGFWNSDRAILLARAETKLGSRGI